MVTGLIVLAVVLAAASAAGVGIRLRSGRFRAGASSSRQYSRAGGSQPDSAAGRSQPDSAAGRSQPARTAPANARRATAAAAVLTAADLGAPLGERATLVQFSTEFCSYCGPTRELLAEVARSLAGVALVEIDAARRLDLASRLNVLSTPTIFVLAPDGSIAQRASGLPRKSAVLAALSSVLGGGAS